jgi:predicted Zn-dependent peptidase
MRRDLTAASDRLDRHVMPTTRLDPEAASSVLDNGLRVVTVALPHLHTCTLALYLHAGPRHEAPEENGLSHMVEHMLFRGTARHRTSRAVSEAVESLGASLDGATDRDLSVLNMSLPPERLGEALELLGEVVRRPRFADIEAERALMLEEMSEDYDEDGRETNAEDLACGAQFDGHPLGQRVIGPWENVRRFTRAQVKRHHARFYVATNAILCAAGPVVHDSVARLAARRLGALPPGAPAAPLAAPPVGGGPRLVHSACAGPSVSIALTLRGPTRTEPRAWAAFEALLFVLDGGMAGRVYQRLCVRDGLAYTVDAAIADHGDASLLQFTAEVSPANLVRVVADTLDVLRGLARRPVSESELRRVLETYRLSVLGQLDDPGAMTEWFGAARLFREPLPPSQRLALMSRVTPRDVMLVARQVARPEGLALAVVGPVGRAARRALRAATAGVRS